jgi:hypothetical protein
MSNDSPVVPTVSARALASRRNGARSRGPKTAAGKARSSRNALKHGLCAQKILVLAEEDVAAFCIHGAVRGARARGRAPDGARAAGGVRRLAPAPRRPHGGRGADRAALRGRRPWSRPDPRRQRRPRPADAPALPRHGPRRVHALPAHPPGAPGRDARRRSARSAARKAARPIFARKPKRTRDDAAERPPDPRGRRAPGRAGPAPRRPPRAAADRPDDRAGPGKPGGPTTRSAGSGIAGRPGRDRPAAGAAAPPSPSATKRTREMTPPRSLEPGASHRSAA